MNASSYYSSSFFTSTAIAILLHIIFLGWLLYFSMEVKVTHPVIHPKIVVKTIKLKPSLPKNSPPQQTVKKASSINNSTEIKNKVIESVKKEIPAKSKPKSSKKPIPVVKPAIEKLSLNKSVQSKLPTDSTKKKEVDLEQQALLLKAKESMANIQVPSLSKWENLKESTILKTQINQDLKNLNKNELFYEDELRSQLQLSLKLPEAGRIVLDLTLNKMGKVEKLVIIEAKSSINKKYVEQILPFLQMPAFGIHFKEINEKTFRLELRGEI